MPTSGNAHAILWEFRVSPESVADFEQYYGPEGVWAHLFKRSRDYIETLLLRDTSDAERFVTVDRWRNEDAYLAFRSEFATQYARLDGMCERFTVDERLLGAFAELSSETPLKPNPLDGSGRRMAR